VKIRASSTLSVFRTVPLPSGLEDEIEILFLSAAVESYSLTSSFPLTFMSLLPREQPATSLTAPVLESFPILIAGYSCKKKRHGKKN
jgi:hypothetical protein